MILGDLQVVFSLQQLTAHAGVDGAHPPSKQQPLRYEADRIRVDNAVKSRRQGSCCHASFDAHRMPHARPLRRYIVVHHSHVAPEQHAGAK